MIVRGSDVSPTPWANGGGSTRELYVGELDGVRWRLSMALVEGSGAFSELPGVARSLMLVSGDVRLSFDDGPWLSLGEPITFDGATPVTYEAAERSEDLGVMVWGPSPAPLAVVDIDGLLTLGPDEHRAAVVLGGELEVDGARLGFRDAVIVDAATRLSGQAKIVIVSR